MIRYSPIFILRSDGIIHLEILNFRVTLTFERESGMIHNPISKVHVS